MSDPQSIFLPAKRRTGRKRKGAAAAAGVGPLALAAAVYAAGEEPTLTLSFDRAIDVGGVDGSAIHVIDGPIGTEYAATGGVTVIGATTVRLGLVFFQDAGAEQVMLNATGGNGIVAAGGGAAWAGVSDLSLPFP
jgi:hypothetical protein